MRLFRRHLSRLSRRAQLESAGGVTQFAEVLRLVKQTPDVVDLGQGFPDFEGNQVARDVARLPAGSDVRLNQYTPPSGLPALHEAIASFNGRRWREELEPGVNTLVTAGGTEAIFSALIALCNPGDTVAFCQPFWPWYLPSIRLTGAVPAPLTLAPPDFKLDVDALLRQLVRERKPKGCSSPTRRTTRRAPCCRRPTSARSPRSASSTTCSPSPTMFTTMWSSRRRGCTTSAWRTCPGWRSGRSPWARPQSSSR